MLDHHLHHFLFNIFFLLGGTWMRTLFLPVNVIVHFLCIDLYLSCPAACTILAGFLVALNKISITRKMMFRYCYRWRMLLLLYYWMLICMNYLGIIVMGFWCILVCCSLSMMANQNQNLILVDEEHSECFRFLLY